MTLLTGCGPQLREWDPLDPYDSGGPLLGEQAAYDVLHYDLAVEVFPDTRQIHGSVAVRARVGSPLERLVLDLDPVLSVRVVTSADGKRTLPFERRGPKLWIDLGRTLESGEEVRVTVVYGGTPREAPNPPWQGGFTWKATTGALPWIATTCQGEGADVWWPVKDHVSDEPDSMDLHITVPDPLVVASNGRLERAEPLGDGRTTYHWHVSTPINTYNVALNIAPYEKIERTFTSVAGETFPVVFYVLPESLTAGKKLFEEILDHLRFYEEVVGPYPFRADKYGVAQTPHPGMEHQSIIAYGADFDRRFMTGGLDFGFDVLHHHELSHEWWGNLVTNADWKDMWLHEGFGTYMQPLYLERTQGAEKAREYLASLKPRIANEFPVAPRETLSAKQVYGGDIYFKGAWVLHTLRYLIGDETFFKVLRRMAYPTVDAEKSTGGEACRFASTSDVLQLVESLSGLELDWFFDVYLRQSELPRLAVRRRGNELTLRWRTGSDEPFPMPIDVHLGEEVRRVNCPEGVGTIEIPAGIEPEIDPLDRVLRE